MNVMKRSILYFFASFLNAGLQNVLPQVFFSERYPQHQALLLSICLLAGAAASLFTIFMYRTHDETRFKASAWFEVLLIAALLISLWLWSNVVPYILSFLFLRALIQIVYNRMDHHYVSMTKQHAMGRYARFATLFQLVGIMLGPLYFSVVYADVSVNAVVVVLLALLLLWSFRGTLVPKTGNGITQVEMGESAVTEPASVPAHKESHVSRVQSRTKPGRSALFFILYLLAATTGVHIFSNNVIMIVRTMYHLSSPVMKSGILLMVMNASGIASVALLPYVERRLNGAFLRPARWMRGHFVYAVLFLFCVLLLRWPLALTYPYLIVLSVLTGSVYGLFWTKSREYAVQGLSGQNTGWILTMYNNANNFSILFSAVVLFLSAIISTQFGTAYPRVILNALLAFFVAAGYFAITLDSRIRKFRYGRET